MKRTKIIPIRLIQENHDIDLDGVPNYRDCQPFNPNKLNYSKIIKLELTLMALIIGGIIMSLIIPNSYIFPFTVVAIIFGSISMLGMLKCFEYIELKNNIKNLNEQREEREFDECMEKINQPNRKSFHVSELPPILQDMVNGVYREEFRYDPFRPRPKRKK